MKGKASFHPYFHVRSGLVAWMSRGREGGKVVGGNWCLRSAHWFGHVRVGVNEGSDGRGWRTHPGEMAFAYEGEI